MAKGKNPFAKGKAAPFPKKGEKAKGKGKCPDCGKDYAKCKCK